MKKIFELHILSLFLVFNSYLFADAPLWYENIEMVYPDEKYIAQIGYGKDKNTAAIDALDSIARFFSTTMSTNVKAKTMLRSESQNTDIKRELEVTTLVQSQIKLFAVEYSKPYFDKKIKQTVIVVYIDREKAWQIYEAKIKKSAISFFQQYQNAFMQTDKLKKYFLLSKAKPLSNDFLIAYEFALLLYPSKCRTFYGDLNDKANLLDVSMNELKMECSMTVVVKNDSSSMIQRKISSLLSETGFVIQKQNGTYQVLVNCACDVTEEKNSYGRTFTSYPSIEVIINNDEKTIFSYVKTCKKTVAFERQKNITLSYQKLEKELENSFINELMTF